MKKSKTRSPGARLIELRNHFLERFGLTVNGRRALMVGLADIETCMLHLARKHHLIEALGAAQAALDAAKAEDRTLSGEELLEALKVHVAALPSELPEPKDRGRSYVLEGLVTEVPLKVAEDPQ